MAVKDLSIIDPEVWVSAIAKFTALPAFWPLVAIAVGILVFTIYMKYRNKYKF